MYPYFHMKLEGYLILGNCQVLKIAQVAQRLLDMKLTLALVKIIGSQRNPMTLKEYEWENSELEQGRLTQTIISFWALVVYFHPFGP